MRVLLTRPNRIDGRAGDIVEVSPARASFLIGMKLAVPAEIREQIATPEKRAKAAPEEKKPAKTAAKKTTKAKK